MIWRIYYSNGTVTDGETQSDWINAPSQNVIGIALKRGIDKWGEILHGWVMGSDWYWWNDVTGEIEGGLTHELEGQWVEYDGPENASRKTGLWIDDVEYENIRISMYEWMMNG